jgi:hypothetical protein
MPWVVPIVQIHSDSVAPDPGPSLRRSNRLIYASLDSEPAPQPCLRRSSRRSMSIRELSPNPSRSRHQDQVVTDHGGRPRSENRLQVDFNLVSTASGRLQCNHRYVHLHPFFCHCQLHPLLDTSRSRSSSPDLQEQLNNSQHMNGSSNAQSQSDDFDDMPVLLLSNTSTPATSRSNSPLQRDSAPVPRAPLRPPPVLQPM